jgi:hypothetical protein
LANSHSPLALSFWLLAIVKILKFNQSETAKKTKLQKINGRKIKNGSHPMLGGFLFGTNIPWREL